MAEDRLFDDSMLVPLALVRAYITTFDRRPEGVNPLQEIVQPFLDGCRADGIPVDQAFGRLVTYLVSQAADWFCETEGQSLGLGLLDVDRLLAKLDSMEMEILWMQEAERRVDGSD